MAPPERTYDAVFRPLKRGERMYASLGPAGPYFPEVAARVQASGEGVIRCHVAADGALNGCKPIVQTPSNSGFAVAARIMAERGRIFVTGAVSPGETILVRVPFVLGAPVEMEH